jgi:hypothetical protein
MINKIFVIGFVLLHLSRIGLFAQEFPRGDPEYIKSLKKVIADITDSKPLNLSQIEKVIPISVGEYFTYYDYTSASKSEETVKAFYNLDSMIYANAKLNKPKFTEKVIKMSQFVDGEYAEAYFEYLEDIIKLNTKCFCKTYVSLIGDAKLRLEGLYLQNCKKN